MRMSRSVIVHGGIVSFSGIRIIPSFVWAVVIAVRTSSAVLVRKAIVGYVSLQIWIQVVVGRRWSRAIIASTSSTRERRICLDEMFVK
jgi:hypothetical protein